MHLFSTSLLTLLFLCSCSSRIPEPVSYHYSQQNKMQASAHWEVLASDLANRINTQLIKTDNVNKDIFVKQTCGNEANACKPNETSSFNEAFRDLLITDLYKFGVPTINRPDEDAIEVLYKVQVVHHNTNRVRTLQPGILTGLSAAVTVLRDAPTNLILLTSGVVADLANTSLVGSGHNEVIITTSMLRHDRYLFRASDIYYINDKDLYHYQENIPRTKTIRVSGGPIIGQYPYPELLAAASKTAAELSANQGSVYKTDI